MPTTATTTQEGVSTSGRRWAEKTAEGRAQRIRTNTEMEPSLISRVWFSRRFLQNFRSSFLSLGSCLPSDARSCCFSCQAGDISLWEPRCPSNIFSCQVSGCVPSPLRSHGQHLPWVVDSGLQDLPRESAAALVLSRLFWSSWPIPGYDFFTPESRESGNGRPTRCVMGSYCSASAHCSACQHQFPLP